MIVPNILDPGVRRGLVIASCLYLLSLNHPSEGRSTCCAILPGNIQTGGIGESNFGVQALYNCSIV